jgi:hypothetical protein
MRQYHADSGGKNGEMDACSHRLVGTDARGYSRNGSGCNPFEGQLCSKEQRICSLARSMEVDEWLCADSGLVHSLIEVNANHVGRGRGNATPALPHFAVKPVAAGAADLARPQLVHLIVAKLHSLIEPHGARPNTTWLRFPEPTILGAPPLGLCLPGAQRTENAAGKRKRHRTTRIRRTEPQKFRITHPFHPLSGREFEGTKSTQEAHAKDFGQGGLIDVSSVVPDFANRNQRICIHA